MPTLRRWLALLALVVATTANSSCQLLSLLPSTTWKLNRGPAMDEGPAYFSIPDRQDLPNASSTASTGPEFRQG